MLDMLGVAVNLRVESPSIGTYFCDNTQRVSNMSYQECRKAKWTTLHEKPQMNMVTGLMFE